MIQEFNLREFLKQEIFKLNINADLNSIGESLDSLDRLELVEILEKELGKDLLHLVNDKHFWSNLDNCIEILKKELS